MDLIIIEVPFMTPAYDESLALRNDILRVPLGLDFFKEDLAQEYDQHHLLAYDKNWNILGCLVLKPVDSAIVKMRQVAVKENLQNLKIGSRLVQFAESFCKEKGFSTIVLNARAAVLPFYENLNYNREGKSFYEVGIEHYKMFKKLK